MPAERASMRCVREILSLKHACGASSGSAWSSYVANVETPSGGMRAINTNVTLDGGAAASSFDPETAQPFRSVRPHYAEPRAGRADNRHMLCARASCAHSSIKNFATALAATLSVQRHVGVAR